MDWQPEAHWKTRSGQLHWSGGERSVIGEAIVSHASRRDYHVRFSAGPGFPLMELHRAGDRVVAQGPLARGRWSGNAARAPGNVRTWIDWAASMTSSSATNMSRSQFSAPGSPDRFTFIAH
jgi:hypothetical protein